MRLRLSAPTEGGILALRRHGRVFRYWERDWRITASDSALVAQNRLTGESFEIPWSEITELRYLHGD